MGDLNIFYYSCLRADGVTEEVVLVGSSINKPMTTENNLQNGRDSYEYFRIVESEQLARKFSSQGFHVLDGSISHPEDNKRVIINISGHTFFDVTLPKSATTKLGGNLRFWHVAEDQLLSTRLSITTNHWEMGENADCSVNFNMRKIKNLPSVRCDTGFIQSSSNVKMKRIRTQWKKQK